MCVWNPDDGNNKEISKHTHTHKSNTHRHRHTRWTTVRNETCNWDDVCFPSVSWTSPRLIRVDVRGEENECPKGWVVGGFLPSERKREIPPIGVATHTRNHLGTHWLESSSGGKFWKKLKRKWEESNYYQDGDHDVSINRSCRVFPSFLWRETIWIIFNRQNFI